MDTELVSRIDEAAGPRGRSDFVRQAVVTALDQRARAAAIRAARGSLRAAHEWDKDPAAWVRGQRRADTRRSG